MQIKVIAVGSTKWQHFIRRWGISFLIGDDVLFDTFGDPAVFLNNARKMDIDLLKIRHIVLSHDDWDHISGLWWIINRHRNLTVYICPGFKEEIKEKIKSFGVNLVQTSPFQEIENGIYSTGELCGESGGEKICEQSVVIKTADGLAIICGCAHPGILDIVRHVKERFHNDVHSLIGGFHLKNNDNETNIRIIKDLRELRICRIAPMHCVGKPATSMIRQLFEQGFINVREGGAIEL